MVAMVLDTGATAGRARPGSLRSPRSGQLRAAGIETVDSEDFYRRYDGTNFAVSRWEGPPNEEAHAIWASELADRIRQHPDDSSALPRAQGLRVISTGDAAELNSAGFRVTMARTSSRRPYGRA